MVGRNGPASTHPRCRIGDGIIGAYVMPFLPRINLPAVDETVSGEGQWATAWAYRRAGQEIGAGRTLLI
jgi:hypothetical protein